MLQPPPLPSWLDTSEYPFANCYQPLRAGVMHYVDEGHGEPLLFVHGTPTWSFEYRHLISGLSPRFRCVAPDHLGFGLSDRPGAFPYTPEAHADALEEFVTAIGLDRFTLVVHDFGGPIGLRLCMSHPDRVKRVVILNTWMWPFDDDPAMMRKARLAGSALGRWLYRNANFSQRVIMPSAYGNRAALTPAIHRQYLEVFSRARGTNARVQVLHVLARALKDSSSYYARLWEQRAKLRGRPALIIWGMKDSAFQPYLLDRWIRILPDATVARLADSGHWPHEEEPGRVLDVLTRWLDTLSHEP